MTLKEWSDAHSVTPQPIEDGLVSIYASNPGFYRTREYEQLWRLTDYEARYVIGITIVLAPKPTKEE